MPKLGVLEIEVSAREYQEIQNMHGVKWFKDSEGHWISTSERMPLEAAVSAVTGMPIETLMMVDFKLKKKQRYVPPTIVVPGRRKL